MNPRYARGMAEGTRPPDRETGERPSEDEMLLEIDVRLQVAAKHNDVVIEDDSWWSSQAIDDEGREAPAETGRRVRLKIPDAALKRQGRERTARNLGRVAEFTMHARLLNEGVPEDVRTGDPGTDAQIAAYIAGAAGNRFEHFGLTGRLEPSEAEKPPEQREVLFLDLEYFDERLAEKHGKRLTEEDAFRHAEASEKRYFDPRSNEDARAALARATEDERTAGRPAPGETAHGADTAVVRRRGEPVGGRRGPDGKKPDPREKPRSR